MRPSLHLQITGHGVTAVILLVLTAIVVPVLVWAIWGAASALLVGLLFWLFTRAVLGLLRSG